MRRLSFLCSVLALMLLVAVAAAVGPPPRFFTQLQDHFDGRNTNTWQQAYYVNDTFWKGSTSKAPVFLCVGGEGPPLDGSVVVNSVHCSNVVEMLPATGALMFAVEHRYYGCHNMSACPVPKFTNSPEDLKYLSSKQALADLAAFHAYAMDQYGLLDTNLWVSVGGSYPGMLAGWFRLKYPHLAHASVASSAPVQAVVDMVGYNDVVSYAFSVSDNKVGGSDECQIAIQQGHSIIGQLFDTATGRSRLAQLFGHDADWYTKVINQALFAGDGVAYFPAQDNDPSCTDPACDIAKICAIMTNTSIGSDAVDRLAAVRKAQQFSALHGARYEQQADVHTMVLAADHAALRDRSALKNPAIVAQAMQEDTNLMHAMRIGGLNRKHLFATPKPSLSGTETDNLELPNFWGWQVCNEFGFFQTCEVGSGCFFTQGYVTLESQMAYCQALYNISAKKIAENIKETNLYYGGWDSHGSCLLYPNGEVDPWRAQSIINSTNPNIEELWVPGASHHAWTHETLPSDQQSVVDARKTIRNWITSILNKYC